MKKVNFKYSKNNMTAAHRLEILKTITGKYELFVYDLFGNTEFTIYKGKSKLKAELLRNYFQEHIRALRHKIDEVL